jgi:hypothetical protein
MYVLQFCSRFELHHSNFGELDVAVGHSSLTEWAGSLTDFIAGGKHDAVTSCADVNESCRAVDHPCAMTNSDAQTFVSVLASIGKIALLNSGNRCSSRAFVTF